MSESELERELHRLGQELMHKLLQGHREQRDSAEAADPVEGTVEVDVIERSQRRVPEGHPETTTCATVLAARRVAGASGTPRGDADPWRSVRTPVIAGEVPFSLIESGGDGFVVLISMCNRRVDCAGPDWTIDARCREESSSTDGSTA